MRASPGAATAKHRRRALPGSDRAHYLDRYRDHLFGHPLARDGRGRANLGRDMQDQPAQVALTSNLHGPDYVRPVCGTLDGLLRAFAELVRSGQATARPDLDRYTRNSALRRRVSQWSKESGNRPTTSQPTFSSLL